MHDLTLSTFQLGLKWTPHLFNVYSIQIFVFHVIKIWHFNERSGIGSKGPPASVIDHQAENHVKYKYQEWEQSKDHVRVQSKINLSYLLTKRFSHFINVLPVVEVISQRIIILPVVVGWWIPAVLIFVMTRSWCEPWDWMLVKSPLSFWNNLTVSRWIFSRIIWHSLMVEVKLICIFSISVNKILWLCEQEMITERFCSLTKVVVIFSSPS